MHTYDHFGWYSGADFPDRIADRAPGLLTTTTVAGELRANWTGFDWAVLPYQPPPTPAVALPTSVAEYDAALVAWLDSVAQSDNWVDRVSLAVRAGYPNKWQQLATRFGIWMDACNEQCLQMQADFEAGRIPQPTIAEMLASLPPFNFDEGA